MIYKPYGRTGKQVSAIGLGGMRFGPNVDTAVRVIHRASELGINYFDTAPVYYADGKSEDFFGEAFKSMPGEFYVSTKSMDRSGADLRRSLENSLRRMGVPKIHFFHIWSVLSLADYRQRIVAGGAYDAARKAKEEGLIDHIVVSTHASGDEIRIIAEEGLFEGFTLGYNASNFPFRRTGLQAAYTHGMGVATMNPLGGGLIPKNEQYFSFLREYPDETIAQAALRFNTSHREITVALSGMKTIQEVEENVRALDHWRELTDLEIQQMQDQVSEKMDSLCTGCGYCRDCPANIDIPKQMAGYNQYLLTGKEESIGQHLGWYFGPLQNNAGECQECGLCEAKCTQHLPIIERLRTVARNR